jgi:hypothetical protein
MTCPQTSHVLESMLLPTHPIPIRRKLLNSIPGSVSYLANNPSGSHIIDACWHATDGIKHYREKIAKEMAEGEDEIRNDFFGKRVWRNWNMDGFIAGRYDWGRRFGGQEVGQQFAKRPVVKEKPWQKKAREKMNEGGRGSGANNVSVKRVVQ